MSHYVNYAVVTAPEDFRTWWRGKVPCYQDGCRSVVFKNGRVSDKATAKSIAEGKKAMDHYPSDYTCEVWDCGVSGWVATRKVTRIVNHHKTEVTETRTYKSRPKTPLKGSRLEQQHTYAIAYNARCYDPGEHGWLPGAIDDLSHY